MPTLRTWCRGRGRGGPGAQPKDPRHPQPPPSARTQPTPRLRPPVSTPPSAHTGEPKRCSRTLSGWRPPCRSSLPPERRNNAGGAADRAGQGRASLCPWGRRWTAHLQCNVAESPGESGAGRRVTEKRRQLISLSAARHSCSVHSGRGGRDPCTAPHAAMVLPDSCHMTSRPQALLYLRLLSRHRCKACRGCGYYCDG